MVLSAKFHPLVSVNSLTWERGGKKASVSKSFVLFPQTAALLSLALSFSHLFAPMLLLKGAGGFL